MSLAAYRATTVTGSGRYPNLHASVQAGANGYSS